MPTGVVHLVFPHQLFADVLQLDKQTTILLIEDNLFFTQLSFHKQKLLLHRASMARFADDLQAHGFDARIIEQSDQPSMDKLSTELTRLKATKVSYYDLVDDWLQQRLSDVITKLHLDAERYQSPGFLTSLGQIDEYFSNNANRMQYFYEWQRKRLNVLMDGDKPTGGKWSYDEANRKKLPKDTTLPSAYHRKKSTYIDAAERSVEQDFADNPGTTQGFNYPISHDEASARLGDFLQHRLALFGPYEDAISSDAGELFHSVLSAPLNIGLLTPQQVLDETLRYSQTHDVPIESLEGFIRQIIGWREYMRATYVRYGSEMRTKNQMNFKNTLQVGWWDGSVGIKPIDTVVKRVLQTAYAHHIERLMICGNAMALLRIDPDQAYEWFMSLFIDAYDWVMVPNVYAMSQFAAGEMITTKPYVSGSNYIIKMSDYKKGQWSDTWDALYWKFISDHRQMFERNYRSSMVVKLYDKFDAAKKQRLSRLANQWIE